MGTISASGSPNSHGLNLVHEQRMKSLRDTYRYVRGHKFRGNIQCVLGAFKHRSSKSIINLSNFMLGPLCQPSIEGPEGERK